MQRIALTSPHEVAREGAPLHRDRAEKKAVEVTCLLERHAFFAGHRLELLRVTHSTHSIFMEYKDPITGPETHLLVKQVITSSDSQYAAAASVQREFTALKMVRAQLGEEFGRSIPYPLLAIPEAGLMVTRRLRGTLVSQVLQRQANLAVALLSINRICRMAHNIGLWLRRFHQATRQPDILLSASAFEREMSLQLDRCKDRGLEARAADAMLEAASNSIRPMEALALPAAARHGDFTIRNILLDDEQIRVFDFENFAESDTVYEDVGKFVAYITLLRGRPGYSRRALGSVRELFLKGYGGTLQSNLVDLFAMKAATRMLAHRGMNRAWLVAFVDRLYVRNFLSLYREKTA